MEIRYHSLMQATAIVGTYVVRQLAGKGWSVDQRWDDRFLPTDFDLFGHSGQRHYPDYPGNRKWMFPRESVLQVSPDGLVAYLDPVACFPTNWSLAVF
jgi:hypothetical protein